MAISRKERKRRAEQSRIAKVSDLLPDSTVPKDTKQENKTGNGVPIQNASHYSAFNLKGYSPFGNPLPEKTFWEKLSEWSKNNAVWGVVGMITSAIAALVPNAISAILFLASWIIISVAIYRGSLFANKPLKHQILLKTCFSLLSIVIFGSFWAYFKQGKQGVTAEEVKQIIEENNDKKLKKELLENKELKIQVNQLSNEILQFVADRNSNRPEIEPIDISEIKPSKDGKGIAKESAAAYEKYAAERKRQGQMVESYYQETQNEFIKRFGTRYQNILNDLNRRGIDLNNGYTVFRAQTNPLTMQGAAVWLGGLAEQLPDTK